MDKELDYRAKRKMAQCIVQAELAFKRSFAQPTLTYQLRGKSAGKAYLQLNEIRINPILFTENPQAFLDEVIPHEVAHLITYQVYGRVRPHGSEWKGIMNSVDRKSVV